MERETHPSPKQCCGSFQKYWSGYPEGNQDLVQSYSLFAEGRRTIESHVGKNKHETNKHETCKKTNMKRVKNKKREEIQVYHPVMQGHVYLI